jgi:hypothetical protein
MPTKYILDSDDILRDAFWTNANVATLPQFVRYITSGDTPRKGVVPAPPSDTDRRVLLTHGWDFRAVASTILGWDGSKAPVLLPLGTANGVASLDSNGLVPSAQLPAKTVDAQVVVANAAARLALSSTQVQTGDFVKETDTGYVYELVDDSAISTAASWIKIKGIIATDIGDSTSPGRALLTAATNIAQRTALDLIPSSQNAMIWASKSTVATDIRTGITAYDPAKPFATLAAAKSVAASRDCITVTPGIYNENNLFKNGANWMLTPGAAINYSGSGVAAIFDDSAAGANGPITSIISGSGYLKNTGSGAARQLVVVSNPSSDIHLELDRATCGADPGDGDIEASCIWQTEGKIKATIGSVDGNPGGGYVGYWVNGDMDLNFQKVVVENQGFVGVCAATPTGTMRVRANYIESTASYAVNNSSSHVDARMWVDALELVGGNGVSIVSIAAGKLYVTAQKLRGGVDIQNGDCYIQSQKIASYITGPAAILRLSGGTSDIYVGIVDPNTTLGSHYAAQVSGGVHRIRAMRFTGAATNKGVAISAGTLILEGATIDTSANSGVSPIEISGGTVYLKNCRLIPHSSQPSISWSAGTVNSQGSYQVGGIANSGFSMLGDFNGSPCERYRTTAAGTAYSFTASSALVHLGTTDPTLVLTVAGKYKIRGWAVVQFNGATFASSRTVTLKVRRTNNTAADLTGGSVTLVTGVTTTQTGTLAIVSWETDDYVTTNTGDILSIFGDVSVVPSAGSLDVVEAWIRAERVG